MSKATTIELDVPEGEEEEKSGDDNQGEDNPASPAIPCAVIALSVVIASDRHRGVCSGSS